jgi:regulatory protein YycI of two-component signal transduction system YycFG
LPKETEVTEYLARYKKMEFTLKLAEAKQRAFDKKTEEAIKAGNEKLTVSFEQAEARKAKLLALHQSKSKFQAHAMAVLQEKTAQVEKIQSNMEEIGKEVRTLNARVSIHDQQLAKELQKFMNREGGL